MIRNAKTGITFAASGFSLMELAIVLMIIGTLMSGVLVAVSQSTLNARITTAKAQLREIEDVLYGYAQTNGRLPCPATDTSLGKEDDLGSGVCAEPNGFVPVVTLGLRGSINADGLLLDPWGNPIRYSVASSANFTYAPNLNTLFATGLSSDLTLLQVCDTYDCSGATYADTVPALIYTMGANWAAYSSNNEVQNSGDGTTMLGTYRIKDDVDVIFVSTTYSEENFDDQVVWISPYLLFNRLISAGQLP